MSDTITQPGTTAAQPAPTPAPAKVAAPTGNSVPDIMSQLRSIQAQRQTNEAPILAQIKNSGAQMHNLANTELNRPDEKTPPQPQQPQSDTLGVLANPLIGLLMLASGFTHTPGIAAANALAGAIKGRADHDETAYQDSMKAWRDNIDLMMKRDEEHRAKVQSALEVMKTDVTTGEAMLRAADTEANDQQGLLLTQDRLWNEREQLSNARARLGLEMQTAREQQAINEPKMIAAMKLSAAMKSGDPAKIAEAAQENMVANGGLAKGWSVMTDPGRTDAKGNPVQYRYDVNTGSATTLDGSAPYQPTGAAKVGTAPNMNSPGADKERDTNTLADARFETQYGHPPNPADTQDQTKLAAIRTNIRAGIGVEVLSPPAVDQAARFYLRTGQLQAGMGGQAMRTQILEAATNIAASEGKTVDDYLAGRATLKADTASLAAVTKQLNAAEGYERGAQKSLDLMVSLIPQTPEPLNMRALTSWVRTGATQFGDIQVPAWQAALITSLDQYAKVLSGATGAQGSTDSARALALSLIPPGSTSEQIKAVVPVLRRDMGYKISGYDSQLNDIKNDITNPGQTPALGNLKPMPADKSQLVSGQVYDTTRGPARWDGTQFVLVQ